jgi:hypothetical protein
MNIKKIEEMIRIENSVSWIYYPPAKQTQKKWASLQKAPPPFDPHWLLLGQLFLEHDSGFVSLQEIKSPVDYPISRIAPRQPKGLSGELATSLQRQLNEYDTTEPESFEVCSKETGKLWRIIMNTTYRRATQLNLHDNSLSALQPRFLPVLQQLRELVNQHIKTVQGLIRRTKREIRVTKNNQSNQEASSEKLATVSESLIQSWLKLDSSLPDGLIEKLRREWRRTLKSIEAQLGRLHRKAEDQLLSLLTHHESLTGIRLQLGNTWPDLVETICELNVADSSREVPVAIAIDKAQLIQPSYVQLQSLQGRRQKLLYEIRRTKKHQLPKLAGYFWAICFSPPVGYYLDIWLLFENSGKPVGPDQLTKLWETFGSCLFFYKTKADSQQLPLRPVLRNHLSELKRMANANGSGLNGWFQESLGTLTSKNTGTESRVLSDLKTLKRQGQREFQLDNLNEGLNVLQQYYQGCFFRPTSIERFGKSLPAVGRSQLKVKEKKLSKAQRLSKTLPQLILTLCTSKRI